MKIQKTYQFKLRLTPSQVEYFTQCIARCRFLYNLAKETREWAYRVYGVSLNYYDLAKQLTDLKKQEVWLKEVPAQTLQDVLERQERAFKNFFEGRAKYPNWAKKHRYNSITFKSVKQDTHNRVKLPKIGSVKYFASRRIEGKLQRATVIRKPDGYYISILTIQEASIQSIPLRENQAIGIDMGVSLFAVTSDGEIVENPSFLKTSLPALRIAQRSLARKVRFSNNWYKQKRIVNKLHQKISRQRKDFLHKVSTRLVAENNAVFVENLSIRNMSRSAKGDAENPGKNVRAKSGLNRSMLDLGVHSFFTMLEYKSQWSGKVFQKVDPKYTSQTCSECGHVSKNNRKTQATFCCEACGYSTNADYNASVNILKRGLGKSSSRQRGALARA